MKPLCIYHGNCADGFGAAWVVRKFFGAGNVDFHAGVYQDPPPDVTGRDVVLVDFSYKRPVLEEMARQARSILILDHHKSAAEDLAGLPPPISGIWVDHLADARGAVSDGTDPRLPRALFDMERSGAGLAWDFFFGGDRPMLIDHIEDRDLWRFDMHGTEAIQAVVFSHPYDFAVWDRLVTRCEVERQAMMDEGAGILRKHHKDVAELVAVTRRTMVIGGARVPVANLPYTLTSDAGLLMCQPVNLPDVWVPPFAACYWDTPAGRVFSLRSAKDGRDVSQVAAAYGGGGHRHAAGFRMPIGWEGDDGGEGTQGVGQGRRETAAE